MPQLDQTSREFRNIQVLVRFMLRIAILCGFATLGSIGFVRSLNALLWMSAIMSLGVSLLKRESPFDSALTYWDEAAAYGSLCCLVSALTAASAS